MLGANPSDVDQPDTDGMLEEPLVTKRIRVLDPYGLIGSFMPERVAQVVEL
jgi:hypothetical protein